MATDGESGLMLCDRCHLNESTVHLQHVGDGTGGTVNLCLTCAGKALGKGLALEGVDMNKLLRDFAAIAVAEISPGEADVTGGETACSVCGLTLRELRQRGHLGCADCYRAFRKELGGMLERLHHGTRHRGTVPGETLAAGSVHLIERQAMELQLARAIADEAFEFAAELRDALRHMDKQANGGD